MAITATLKNPDAKPCRKKYATLAAAFPAMLGEYLLGSDPGEICARFRPIVSKPISLVTFKDMLSKTQATRRRKALRKAEASADMKIAKAANNTALVERMANEILDRKSKGALRHLARMERHVDRVQAVLEKTKPVAKRLFTHLSSLEKFDEIGRRLYDIDKSGQLSPQQLNVAVLISSDPSQLKRKDDAIDADVEAA